MGIEVGLIPAVILGIYNALQGKGQTPKWIKYAALAAAVAGTVFSHHYFQGIKNLDQALEISSLIGSLFGLFLAAEERPAGYLWFLLMNGGMAALVLHQGYGWLFLQQIASLYFVLDAYVQTRKEKSERASTANSA